MKVTVEEANTGQTAGTLKAGLKPGALFQGKWETLDGS